MNFSALPFVRHAQPGGVLAVYTAFIFVLALAISPVRAADLHTARIGVVKPRCSGEFRAIATDMQVHCLDVATVQHLGAAAAREGDSLCIGQPPAASRLVYKTRLVERIVAYEAARAARCVSFPSCGMLGVNAAGAVRGNGAGVPFDFADGHPREVTNARAAGTTGPFIRLRGFNPEASRV